jgi:hypothetical protein
MASSSAAVVFTTKTPYVLPSQKFMIPHDWKRYQLSQLINKALSLAQPIPFDFLVRGAILRTTLGECRAENGITEVRLALGDSVDRVHDNRANGQDRKTPSSLSISSRCYRHSV